MTSKSPQSAPPSDASDRAAQEARASAEALPARARFEVMTQTAHGHQTVHRPAGATSEQEARDAVAELLPYGTEVVGVRDVGAA